MAPLVRRTWAPKGITPILKQRGKHREKVSVAGALWLSPQQDQVGLYFETVINGYFNNHRSASFLEHLMREIPERMVVVWDGGPMHKGDPIREKVAQFYPRLVLERLPPYAPMLNPVEYLWNWLKYGQLCNFAPRDGHELNHAVHAQLARVQNDQKTMTGFWHRSQLPFPKSGHYLSDKP